MNAAPSWSTFLAAQGARLDGQGVVDFGAPEAELQAILDRPVLAELGEVAQVEASGADARAFLGGQLTADLRQPAPGRWTLAAWCSPQGRVQTLFGLLDRGQTLDLFFPAEQVSSVLKRLRMFVLRSAVRLEDLSSRTVRLGLTGPGAAEALTMVGLAPPTAPLEACEREGLTLVRLHGARPRFLLVAPLEAAPTLWQRLSAHARPVGREAWLLDRILGGVPSVLEATADRFLPQMLNLEPLGGLSFGKGCYPGQEIIARLKYRGELKRRTFLAACQAPPPAPGTEVYDTEEPGNSAGQVLVAARHPDGGSLLLAVLVITAATGRLRLGGPDGPALSLCELPYPAPA